jgi:transglutaminase-like putative cysteine protease/lipoprotein NlpI
LLAVRGTTLLGVLVLCALAAQAQPAPAPQAPNDGLKEVRISSDKFERQPVLPSWVDPITSLPPTQSKASVVTVLADTQFMVAAQPTVFVHRAWQANTSAPLQSLGTMDVSFNPEYQRAKLHILRIHRAGQVIDKLTMAEIRFLQQETGLDIGAYNGETTASILVDDLRVGDVVEIAYSTTGANPVMGDRFLDYASWDHASPVDRRRVTLIHPVDRKINVRFSGDLNKDYPKPVESVSGPLKKLRWEQRSLPAVDVEASVPLSFSIGRSMQFSEFQSWAEVSDWADQLFRSNAPLPPEILQVVKGLGAKPTMDERVSGALQWVQNEIRYFSVSLGESSHRPTQPALTLQRRYGDCKDKSFMLIEMLRALGVKAQPVLVSTRVRDGLPQWLPSPYAFNHAIVRAEVDGKTYFLDPTLIGQTGRLDTLGQPHEGTEVLVIQPGNSSFTRIKSADYAAISRNELIEKISLPKFGGEGTLESLHLWSGASAEARRIQLASWTAEQRDKIFRETYERRYPGIRFSEPPQVMDDTFNNTISVKTRYTIPNLAITAGGEWGVRYSASNLAGMVVMPASVNRAQPLAMEVLPRKSRYSVEIEFPPEVSVVRDPLIRSVSDEAFDYRVSSSFRGNRAATTIELAVLKTQVEASRMPAFADALRRTGEIFYPIAVVRKSDIKSSGLLGLSPKTLRQTIEDRLNDGIGKISKSIDSGRLSGDDLSDALCERAESLTDLGKPEEGLKDAQLAVKGSPNAARAYACRGNVYFGLRDYARSIADYSKAISFGGEDSHVMYRRGHARFYNGQLAVAAEDFAKVSQSKQADVDAILYAELWRVWTQKRLGVTPDAAQQALAKTDPGGDWPRPALAMLHGLMTPEQALATLDRKKGDERDMALAEGYFYVGQNYYAQGDKVKAAEFFSKAREKGVILYIEHVAAGIELQQMGAAKP